MASNRLQIDWYNIWTDRQPHAAMRNWKTTPLRSAVLPTAGRFIVPSTTVPTRIHSTVTSTMRIKRTLLLSRTTRVCVDSGEPVWWCYGVGSESPRLNIDGRSIGDLRAEPSARTSRCRWISSSLSGRVGAAIVAVRTWAPGSTVIYITTYNPQAVFTSLLIFPFL